MTLKKILCVFGTRPEAIKFAPIILEAKLSEKFDIRVCVTGQHRELLYQALGLFGIKADLDLEIMKDNQGLTDITCAILQKLNPVLIDFAPDLVLVHGDTTTTFAASLASFYAGYPVGHVEAGLRTYDKMAPWPEEVNRQLTSCVADLHFAPTENSAKNLLSEKKKGGEVFVTGNTVIDAVQWALTRIRADAGLEHDMFKRFNFLDTRKHMILVTAHRRENFGKGFENIANALLEIAERDDVEVVLPLHMNPNVQVPIKAKLEGQANIHLIEPLDYLDFVYVMSRSHLILTDSGGIQEEAPALGKPVLVMRDTTERPEGVTSGNIKLVGTEVESIVRSTLSLLDDPSVYSSMSNAKNPYGNGDSAKIILSIIESHLDSGVN